MEKDHRKIIISWCLYDWANSAFASTIMAAVLPVFYSSVAGANLSKTTASSYWGYTNTIAMLIVAFSAPILGALADHCGMKKRFLASLPGWESFPRPCSFLSAGGIGSWPLCFISWAWWVFRGGKIFTTPSFPM